MFRSTTANNGWFDGLWRLFYDGCRIAFSLGLFGEPNNSCLRRTQQVRTEQVPFFEQVPFYEQFPLMHHLSVTRYSSTCAGRRSGLLAAIAVAMWMGLPTDARAGCGDYVIVTNPQVTGEEGAGGVLPRAMADHSSPVAPCQGLGCQQREPLPAPPAPAIPAPPPQQDLALLSAAWQPSGFSAVSALDFSLAVAVEGHRRRIDRPPRV